ncbi:MAG: flagellar brake protein [Desulfobacterales bacterium]|nr:flagellar brake protein [Desulfobacterales bacterium]
MNLETPQGRSQRLFIELGTALLLEPLHIDSSISCELTGMQVGKYLIAKLNSPPEEKASLAPGGELNVKYILANDVFGFKTRIIQILEEPDYLAFMEYPDQVKNMNIRADKRMECFLPIRLEIQDRMFKGNVVNLNKSGCLCRMDNCDFDKGLRGCHLILHLAYGQFESLAVHGEIRSHRQVGDQTSLGILFDPLDGFSQKVLSALVPSLRI